MLWLKCLWGVKSLVKLFFIVCHWSLMKECLLANPAANFGHQNRANWDWSLWIADSDTCDMVFMFSDIQNYHFRKLCYFQQIQQKHSLILKYNASDVVSCLSRGDWPLCQYDVLTMNENNCHHRCNAWWDMSLFSFILWPHSLDNCLAVNNTTSPSPTKVACRVRGHTVAAAARGTYGVHMKRTMREWSNAVGGALFPKSKSPLAISFHPQGRTSAVC